jgi:hypothetical protein
MKIQARFENLLMIKAADAPMPKPAAPIPGQKPIYGSSIFHGLISR